MIDALKFIQPKTLYFTIILLICMGTFALAQDTTIQLEKIAIQLKEVVVSEKKPKFIILGTRRFTPLFWVSVSGRDGNYYEHGKLLHIKKPSKLLTANVRVGSDKKSRDSVTYRLNIYKVRNGLPVERLLDKEFVKTFSCRANLLTFNMISEKIYLDQDCVVSFEYMHKLDKKGDPISFRANMTGGDAFVSTINSNVWTPFKNGSVAIFIEVEQ
ncbi:hypothetical protein IWX76_000437 [Pedobacter sp. CAN_A7]|uniref:hypothetical protein n=1 Tax=Pedobacter sp. CAN_A7 TaxID=2787722 RepID=UPI0018C93F0D